MRFGIAIDLDAPASRRDDVTWRTIHDQVHLAEELGFDLVALPDHLAYRASGEGDYVDPDEPVGARESMTVAAAIAATTDRIGITHSVVNAPYRQPAMLAHLATTLHDISGGRYAVGIGVGNSFDYDQLGVAADRRVARFEESVAIVAELLHDGRSDRAGDHWSTVDAELALRSDDRAELQIAAGGPRTMRVAARFGDAWNGFAPCDPDAEALDGLLDGLERACRDEERDPATLRRPVDMVVDPLDRAGARTRSLGALGALPERGIDEVRLYALSDRTAAGRASAIAAARILVDDL